MPARLVAIDEGPDITLDRAMVVVGRHPACDTRLDSLRVSRHHCCMTHENGEVVVRDLGSTNGIRINGQRIEIGRMRPGDELSIAHIRYRLENGQGHEQTIAEPAGLVLGRAEVEEHVPAIKAQQEDVGHFGGPAENAVVAAVRKALPLGVADKCRIQVIVQMPGDRPSSPEPEVAPLGSNHAAENAAECRSDSCH